MSSDPSDRKGYRRIAPSSVRVRLHVRHHKRIIDLIDTEVRRHGRCDDSRLSFRSAKEITMNSIYKLVIALLARVVLSAFVMWPAMAGAAANPEWAYPITPPPKPLDNTVIRQMTGTPHTLPNELHDSPSNTR